MSEPVDTEAKVTYVLSGIRKLLEKIPASQRPFALNMYCHWALHIDLRGRDTIYQFLEQIDQYIDGVLAGPEDFGASNRIVREFVMLDTLRSQMREFFETNAIDTGLVNLDARWNEFVSNYASVIEGGSLSFAAQDYGLKHVRQVTFAKGKKALGEFSQVPFDMLWVVTLMDGRTIDISVNARAPQAGAGQMISWGIHLH